MNKQLVILLLILILFILTCIYISTNKETFSSTVSTSVSGETTPSTQNIESQSQTNIGEGTDLTDVSNVNSLFNMFASLEEIEKKCEQIEENDDLYNDKQIMKNNDELFKQLEEQDVKINELKDIVKYLSVEKKRKDKVNNKCRENNQNKLNENYSLLKKLNDDGLARDNQIQLDLNVSDTLKSNIGAIKNTLNKNTYNKKCSKPPKNSTNIDKIKLDDKCHGCVNSKIKNNYNHIKKDFKY